MVRSRIEAVGSYLPATEISTAELPAQPAVDSPIDPERISGMRPGSGISWPRAAAISPRRATTT